MFNLGPHADFILISYGAVFFGILGLILQVWLSEKTQQRRLADLERRGVKRRSAE